MGPEVLSVEKRKASGKPRGPTPTGNPQSEATTMRMFRSIVNHAEGGGGPL